LKRGIEMSPLVFYIIILVICLYLISKSADYAISAVTSFARKTGISEFIIGFIIVSIGTSIPEFSTAVMASIADESQLLLGDLIGASIIVVGFVLALTVIISRKIKIKGKTGLDYKSIMVFVLVILACGLMLLGEGISRIDGGILLAGFCIYLVVLWKKEEKLSHMKKQVLFSKIWQDILVFGGCIAALLLAARWLVYSAVGISDIIGIPKHIVGLIIIALGTTIPELTVNMILAIAALIKPFDVPFEIFGISIFFLIGFVVLGLFMLTRKQITWKQGVILLACYIVFITLIILRGG
jgi:cation:H+ antiporter